MRFPPSLLDEIRARLPVSEVVGRRVRLKRQGREFIGLSPFNQEKTPSFTVSDQKGFYHCFSSGRHGDIFRFMMETEGLSFPEAVERLAGEAGVAMPAPDPRSAERQEERAGLQAVTEAAAAFYESALDGPQGRAARDYLAQRGVTDALRQRFRLGYAPAARHTLKEHLAGLGFGSEDMARAGLLITGSDIAVPFDRFRDRLIFPITDLRGRVIAFGGRALQADQQPKYLNSPETELFHKGHVLFNLAAARRAAHDAGSVIVAEGYMDVIALAGAGFANAVAPLGTALTQDQLALLWRIADEPVMCFDGDAAGLRAAFRTIDLALPGLVPGKSLRFALLPEGQDPDDLLRTAGRAAMAAVLDNARPLSQMLWTREIEAGPLDTPERRAAFEVRLRNTVSLIGDSQVRRHYETAIYEQLRHFFGRGAQASGRRNVRGAGHRGKHAMAAERAPAGASAALARRLAVPAGAEPRREAILLLALANHPGLLAERAEEVAGLEFASPEFERLKCALLDIAADGETDRAAGRARLERCGLAETLERAERIWQASGRTEWWVAAEAATIDAACAWEHTAALHRKLVTLHKELKAAETALEGDPSDENLARLFDIQAQLATAAGTEALVEGFGQASGRASRAF
jgi:DNA primase